MRNSTRAISLSDFDKALRRHLDLFLRLWGNTGWRNLIDQVKPVNDAELLELLSAISAIEVDASFMRHKLRAIGVLRMPSVQAYSDVWLSEEVDHGRAFDELALRLSGGSIQGLAPGGDAFARDSRVMLAFPVMWAIRLFRRATLAGYFVRGCLVERQAIVIYGRLARSLHAANAPVAASIVRRIAAQEGRHLKFFTKGAETLLAGSTPRLAAAVRVATQVSFRPPGVDLFGREKWAELMRPLLRDPEVIAELAGVDSAMSNLPGFYNSAIVTRWFNNLYRDYPELSIS